MINVLLDNIVFDFSSVTNIIQLLAFILAIGGFYYFRTIRDNNKTLVELYKLVQKKDVASVLSKSKSVIPIPDSLSNEQQYNLLKEQVLHRHRQYMVKLTIVLVFVILFFVSIFILIYFPIGDKKTSFLSQPKLKFTSKTAKVVGIYPSDVFGPDQKKGLHLAFENSESDINIIDLDFISFKDMKSRRVEVLIDSLRYILKHENVIAIVGPSITECTLDVLKALYENKEKVPLFITSAASSQFLKWNFYSKELNLFRTGSGIDKRADLIARFFQNRELKRKSLFLVEDNSPQPTFGKMYFNELQSKSEVIRNALLSHNIDVMYYRSDTTGTLLSDLEGRILNYDFLFLLGVGKEFSLILNKFYRTTLPYADLPKIGGWMNGYALNSLIGNPIPIYADNKIFEICDMDLDRAINFDVDDDFYLKKFETQVQYKVHPGLRDIAISYDAGVCILQTYMDILRSSNEDPSKFLQFDRTAHVSFSDVMREGTYDAISSKIIFNKSGANENVSLACSIYDGTNNNWKLIYMNDLLDL